MSQRYGIAPSVFLEKPIKELSFDFLVFRAGLALEKETRDREKANKRLGK